MELQDFIKETKRLTDYFEKEYNTQQEKELYQRIKDISVEHYRRIINTIIDKEERLPKANKILDYKELTYDLQSYKPEVYKQVKCNHCKGSGLIKFYEKRNGGIEYEFLARCNCENAKQFDKWIDEKGNNLFPSAIELNLI